MSASKWSGKRKRPAEVLSTLQYLSKETQWRVLQKIDLNCLVAEWTGGDWHGLEGLCRINVGSCNMYWHFKPPSIISAPGPPSLTLKHSLLSGFYVMKFSPTFTCLKRPRGPWLHEDLR